MYVCMYVCMYIYIYIYIYIYNAQEQLTTEAIGCVLHETIFTGKNIISDRPIQPKIPPQ